MLPTLSASSMTGTYTRTIATKEALVKQDYVVPARARSPERLHFKVAMLKRMTREKPVTLTTLFVARFPRPRLHGRVAKRGLESQRRILGSQNELACSVPSYTGQERSGRSRSLPQFPSKRYSRFLWSS